MKYTGIVRRLDSLGRIVIPREYRKMHKIKESDPLEIIAMDNGEILIKKVDLSAELLSAGTLVIDALSEATNLTVLLSDNEKILYVAGNNPKNTYAENPLSQKAMSLLSSRKNYSGNAVELSLGEAFVCVYPVFKEDIFGGIFVLSNSAVSQDDEKIVGVLAKVLGNIMQKY